MVWNIIWANIQAWYFFPLFIFSAIFVVYRHKQITRLLQKLAHEKHLKSLFPKATIGLRSIKTSLLVAGLCTLFIALLQPQWGRKEKIVKQEGRDLLIALDISRSMIAEDMRPNRLEFVKLKIRNLLQKLKTDRIGLILFSGTAFVQCPLTVDHDAFLMFLNQVDVETIASGTTSIDKALLTAIQTFGRSRGRKNKLVLLITDGEDFSNDLQNVKKMAQKEQITLFALGAGSLEGAPIPIIGPRGMKIGYEKDSNGGIALTKLNENFLVSITEELGGMYVRATYADSDIDIIVSAVNKFEKEAFMEKKMSLYEDQYPWFLGLTFLFLALEWIL